MLRSTAIISTSRADRYRDQLARHGAGMLRQARDRGGSAAPPIRDAITTDAAVVLDFAWGRCTVKTSEDALTLVAEAESHEDLAKIQGGVGQRVTRIGRRDELVVAWGAVEGGPSQENAVVAGKPRHSGVPMIVGLAVLVGVIVVIHIGLGLVLLRQPWTWWGLVALGAVVVAKVVAGRHFASTVHRRLPHRSSRS